MENSKQPTFRSYSDLRFSVSAPTQTQAANLHSRDQKEVGNYTGLTAEINDLETLDRIIAIRLEIRNDFRSC